MNNTIKPQVLILVRGGIVCDIVTSMNTLDYRLIDVDNAQEQKIAIEDYRLDNKNFYASKRVNVDIDNYTRTIVEY